MHGKRLLEKDLRYSITGKRTILSLMKCLELYKAVCAGQRIDGKITPTKSEQYVRIMQTERIFGMQIVSEIMKFKENMMISFPHIIYRKPNISKVFFQFYIPAQFLNGQNEFDHLKFNPENLRKAIQWRPKKSSTAPSIIKPYPQSSIKKITVDLSAMKKRLFGVIDMNNLPKISTELTILPDFIKMIAFENMQNNDVLGMFWTNFKEACSDGINCFYKPHQNQTRAIMASYSPSLSGYRIKTNEESGEFVEYEPPHCRIPLLNKIAEISMKSSFIAKTPIKEISEESWYFILILYKIGLPFYGLQ